MPNNTTPTFNPARAFVDEKFRCLNSAKKCTFDGVSVNIKRYPIFFFLLERFGARFSFAKSRSSQRHPIKY